MGEKAGHPFRGNQFSKSKVGKSGGSGNFQPKDVGATGARIEITPTGQRVVQADADTRAAMREISRRPSLQGFGSGPSENTIRRVKAERNFRAEELKKTRASVKEAYQKGVVARKSIKPLRVNEDGEPLRPEKPPGIITPRDLGGIKQFDAYVKGLRGEPRLKPKTAAAPPLTSRGSGPDRIESHSEMKARVKAQVKVQVAKDDAKFTALKNSEKKAKSYLERQNSMAGSGNKFEITPDAISRAATARAVKASALKAKRAEVNKLVSLGLSRQAAKAAAGGPRTPPTTVTNRIDRRDAHIGSYEARIRAAGRGSANRAGNWSRGYGNK